MANPMIDSKGDSLNMSAEQLASQLSAPVGPAMQTRASGPLADQTNKFIDLMKELLKRSEKEADFIENKLPKKLKDLMMEIFKLNNKDAQLIYKELVKVNKKSGGGAAKPRRKKAKPSDDDIEALLSPDYGMARRNKRTVAGLSGDKSRLNDDQRKSAVKDVMDLQNFSHRLNESEKQNLETLREKAALDAASLEDLQNYVKVLSDMNYKYGEAKSLGHEIYKTFIGVAKSGKEIQTQIVEGALALTKSFGESISGGGRVRKVTEGVVDNHLKMVTNMRMYAFEVGASSKDLIKLAMHSNAVAETGQSIEVFQETYLKNLKRGIKDQAISANISKTGLALATKIGANAESTADTMATWHQQLGLSTNEAAQFARSIALTAQQTGVTGDNLMNAVKQAENFAKNMRNAGNLSAAAAGSLVEMAASAEKFGVTDIVAPINEALSSATKFNSASMETKSLIARASQKGGVSLDKARFGGVPGDKASEKGMMEGFKKERDMFLQGRDFASLGIEEQGVINLQAMNAWGFEMGAMIKVIEAMEESTMSFTERMDKNKKQLDQNLTTEERSQLMIKQRDQLLGASMGLLTSFDKELADPKKGLTAGLAKFGTELEKDGESKAKLEALGIDAKGTPQKIMEGLMEKSLMRTNEQLKAAKLTNKIIDKSAVKNALAGGAAGIREFNKMLGDKQNEATNELKALTDPATSADRTLKQIHALLQNTLGGGVQSVMDAVGGTGLIAAELTSMAASAGILDNILKKAKGGFTKVYDKGINGAVGLRNMVTRPAGAALKGPAGVAAKARLMDTGRLARVGGQGVIGSGASAGTGIGSRAAVKAAPFANGMTKLVNIFPRLTPVINGAAKGFAFLARGLSFVATKLPVIGWILTGILATIDGVFGAFKTVKKTAEIFGEKEEDVTMGQKISAGIAGFITGALDGLTMGFFSDILGPESDFAKFIAKAVLFMSPFIMLLDAFNAAVEGVWEGMKELWIVLKEGFIEGFQPLFSVWNDFKTEFNEMLAMFNLGSMQAFKWSDVMKGVKALFKSSMTVLKPFIKALGYIIGTGLAVFLSLFIQLGRAFTWFNKVVLEPIIAGISWGIGIIQKGINLVTDFFGGIYDWIKSILDLKDKGKKFIEDVGKGAASTAAATGKGAVAASGMSLALAGLTSLFKSTSKETDKLTSNEGFDEIQQAIKDEQVRKQYTGEQIGAMNEVANGVKTPKTLGTDSWDTRSRLDRAFAEPVVSTAANQDQIHKEVQRDIASTSPSAETSANVDQAISIQKEMEVQNSMVAQQNDLLQEIRDSLKFKEGALPPADGNANIAYTRPGQKYQWSSRYTDGAQSDVLVG